MNEIIKRYEIEPVVGDIIVVDLPSDSKILSTSSIDDKIFIWVMFQESMMDKDFVSRYFEIFGTGHIIHNDMGIDRKFIGTVLIHGGGLGWHIFERLN